MSNLALPSGDDHPAAAGKHLDDATLLLREGRLDNAAYLAGYVVECSVKTLIQLERNQRKPPPEHDLGKLSRQAQELATLPEARTAPYASTLDTGHAIYDYQGRGWQESLRYRGPGSILAEEAESWVEEAGKIYGDVIVSLRLDGVLC